VPPSWRLRPLQTRHPVQIGVVSVLTGAGLIAVGATRRKRRRIV